jgi:hypothetical protein
LLLETLLFARRKWKNPRVPQRANRAAGGGFQEASTQEEAIVAPNSELKRGHIYFLNPSACSMPATKMKKCSIKNRTSTGSKGKKEHGGQVHHKSCVATSTAELDNYWRELLLQKREMSHRQRWSCGHSREHHRGAVGLFVFCFTIFSHDLADGP